MASLFLGLVLFVVVVLVTAILFGGWIIVKLFKGVASLLGVAPQQSRPTMAAPVIKRGPVVQCRIPGCRHLNPNTARFCRHCGHAMPQIQPLAA